MIETPFQVAARQFGLDEIVDLALNEDIGTGDVTTLATVPADREANGTILAKEAGVISGMDVARFVFRGSTARSASSHS